MKLFAHANGHGPPLKGVVVVVVAVVNFINITPELSEIGGFLSRVGETGYPARWVGRRGGVPELQATNLV